jgi:hypothetical protein
MISTQLVFQELLWHVSDQYAGIMARASRRRRQDAIFPDPNNAIGRFLSL